MNTWITLSTDDIYNYLCKEQLDALRKYGSKEDPLPPLIADITAKIRAEIAAFPKNFLHPAENLLPVFLKSTACFLIIEALQTRLPTLQLTEDQVRSANNARMDLQRVAKGELPINNSYKPTTAVRPIDVVSKRSLQTTYESLHGL